MKNSQLPIPFLVVGALLAASISLRADGISRKLREEIAAAAHPTPEQLGKGWTYLKGKVKHNSGQRMFEKKGPDSERITFRTRTWSEKNALRRIQSGEFRIGAL